jgi:hypothetical protein
LQTQWDFPTANVQLVDIASDVANPLYRSLQALHGVEQPPANPQEVVHPSKKCRPGKRRRDRKREGEQRQLAAPILEEASSYDHASQTDRNRPRNCHGRAIPQSEVGNDSSCDEPMVLSESEDGDHLRVAFYTHQGISEQNLTRTQGHELYIPKGHNHALHPHIKLWLDGQALAQIVRLERGSAGRTPTIVPFGLTEVRDALDILTLEVKFAEFGTYTFRRASGKRMPTEMAPDFSVRPLRWLGKHHTYGSPALNEPLPNRVAEWLDGKNLTPLIPPAKAGPEPHMMLTRWAPLSWNKLFTPFEKLTLTPCIAAGAAVSSLIVYYFLKHQRFKPIMRSL